MAAWGLIYAAVLTNKNVVREFDEDTYGSIDASMYSPAVRNDAARERLADRSIWWISI